MKKILLLFSLPLLMLGASAQNIEKKKERFDNGFAYHYAVEKNSQKNSEIITLTHARRIIVEGQLLSGKKSGCWKIFDKNKNILTLNYLNDSIVETIANESTFAYQNSFKERVSRMAREHFIKNFRAQQMENVPSGHTHPTILLEFNEFGKPINSTLTISTRNHEIDRQILDIFKFFHGLPGIVDGSLSSYNITIPVSITRN